MRIYESTSEAYLESLKDVITNPDYISSPRGLKTYEKMNYQFKVSHPGSNPVTTRSPERNKVIEDYTKKEFDLYASGSDSAEDFGSISKFWKTIANPDGTINSSYGKLIFFDKSCGQGDLLVTPWAWAKSCLISDKDTRQALIKFHKRSHLWSGNKDQVCTLYGNFHIRSNRLHLSIKMRSNDLVKGLVYDISWFCYLLEKMTDELTSYYPWLTVGTYTHSADSFHVYEKDMDKVVQMLGYDPRDNTLELNLAD